MSDLVAIVTSLVETKEKALRDALASVAERRRG